VRPDGPGGSGPSGLARSPSPQRKITLLNTRVPKGATGGLLADSLVLMACGGSKGSKPDAKQLTGKIVGYQTADISHMQQMQVR
jgi:hypothetical protein